MPRKSTKQTTRATLEELTITELNQEIERRRENAVELAEERAELMGRVAEIDEYLAELGVSVSTGRPRGRPRKGGGPARSHAAGANRSRKKTAKKTGRASRGSARGAATGPTKPRGSRKRHKNETNLVDALRDVLKGTTMGVSEVAQAVQDAGYKTTSPNFRTIVNQTLIKHPDVFAKKGRGQYTAK